LHGADDGLFVRFRLIQPDNSRYYVKVAGYVHVANWYLPDKTIPTNALKNAESRLNSGEFTEWLDLKANSARACMDGIIEQAESQNFEYHSSIRVRKG